MKELDTFHTDATCYDNEQEGLTVREQSTLGIITKVYRQQKNHFDSNDPRESIPDRIVSISKPYVRPISREEECG